MHCVYCSLCLLLLEYNLFQSRDLWPFYSTDISHTHPLMSLWKSAWHREGLPWTVLRKWKWFLEVESLCPVFVTQRGGNVWWEQVAVGREACGGRESVTSRVRSIGLRMEPLSISASGQRRGSAWPWMISTRRHWGYRFSSSWDHWTLSLPDPALQRHLMRHGADHKMNMSGWVIAHSWAFPRKGWQAALFQRKGIFSGFSHLRLFTSKSPATRCPGAQKRRRGGLAKGGYFFTACLFQARDRRRAPGHPQSGVQTPSWGTLHPHHVPCWHRRVWSDPWTPSRKRNDSMSRVPHPSPNPQTRMLKPPLTTPATLTATPTQSHRQAAC